MNQPVLTKPIPPGGRQITATEQRNLRALGIRCSKQSRVMPDGDPNYGFLYKPAGTRNWYQAGPRLTTA